MARGPGDRVARGEARLVAIGGLKPREYPLRAGKTAIGSAKDNDIAIDESAVSRYHAVIRRSLGRYSVADLESTNGTFLNGNRITNPSPLKPGDELRFGTARVAFLAKRGGALSGVRKAGAVAAIGAILFAIGFAAMRYHIRTPEPVDSGSPVSTVSAGESAGGGSSPASSASSAAVEAPTAAAIASPAGPEWLTLLNWYRRLCKLAPVSEDPRLSAGDHAHVQYLLTNYSDTLRSGTLPGEEMHLEREGSPGYTPEGADAGKQSDVDFMYWHGAKPNGLVNFAILDWISGAFHRLPLLNPNLHRIGYDDFCGEGLCVAALNAIVGADPPRTGNLYASPVEFPPDGAEVNLRTFTNEWPDPLTSCPGYASPTGLPITLTIGSFIAARLESFSVQRIAPDGTEAKVEACGFDASTYENPDASAQSAARGVLNGNGTVVVIPRRPLDRGATYEISLTASGKSYDWKFSVSP
ncbi:MAG: FHA domain-containing protein [Candidatus Binataceae bacterium]